VKNSTCQVTPVFVLGLVSIQVPDHEGQSTLYDIAWDGALQNRCDGNRWRSSFRHPSRLVCRWARPHGGTVRGFEYDIAFQTSTTEAFCVVICCELGKRLTPQGMSSRSISAAFSDALENYCEIIIHDIPWQTH
jgi:hypothetical protein